ARELLVEAARAAGRLALASFKPGERTAAHIRLKGGGSPVTGADLAVDEFLKRELAGLFPEAGWLSEETEDDETRLSRVQVLIVDPIDGTRAFIDGDPRWTVSIALVAAGRPVAGVVHAPALDETYAASAGGGAALNGEAIAVSGRGRLDGAHIGGPRGLVQALERGGGLTLRLEPKIPSLAYRLALVARGALDLAIASDKSHDWDIAAADLILAEAGGTLVDSNGQGLLYNRADTLHPALFAAPRKLIGQALAAADATKTGRSSLASPA
ncbi:MAG TPA: 3'(2'),5'-bisphosphate nucleotidase CysQ, partial [Roseiarcus sp.]|nr:3'(2'),5'-bisphosphate nucleotidase CysQ [Roseiarcus sp.]